jgi:hypothetical protein
MTTATKHQRNNEQALNALKKAFKAIHKQQQKKER